MFVKSGQDKRRRVRKGVGERGTGWMRMKKGWEEEKNNICLKTKIIIGELETDERSKMEIPKKSFTWKGRGEGLNRK